MSGKHTIVRWYLAVAAAGVFAGGSMGLAAQPQSSEVFSGGCQCTISGDGTGSYACSTPSVCGPGVWSCSVQCGEIKPS
jgi:hypothetical protein